MCVCGARCAWPGLCVKTLAPVSSQAVCVWSQGWEGGGGVGRGREVGCMRTRLLRKGGGCAIPTSMPLRDWPAKTARERPNGPPEAAALLASAQMPDRPVRPLPVCSGGFSNLGAQGEHSIDNRRGPLGTVSPEARRGWGGGGAGRDF